MPTAAFAGGGGGARRGPGEAREGGGAGGAGGRLGAPRERLPRAAAAALEDLDPRRLARLTQGQLVTVCLHLMRIAVKHQRERSRRHGEALDALEQRRRRSRNRAQRAVDRKLQSRGEAAGGRKVLREERERAAVRLQSLARGRAARLRVRRLREERARRYAFNDFCSNVPSLGRRASAVAESSCNPHDNRVDRDSPGSGSRSGAPSPCFFPPQSPV